MNKIYRLPIAIIFVIILSFIYDNEDSYKNIKSSSLPQEFMKELKIKKFDENGQVEMTLTASKWSFSPADGYSKIDKPILTIVKQDAIWHIQSDIGIAYHEKIDSDINDIFLNQNVNIIKKEKNKTTNITAEHINYNLNSTEVRSDSLVTLHNENLKVTGIGMNGNLNKNNVKLLSKVKTFYQKPVS